MKSPWILKGCKDTIFQELRFMNAWRYSVELNLDFILADKSTPVEIVSLE